MDQNIVAENLESIRERLVKACARSGRSEDSVRLVAVSKRIDLALVLAACRAGQWDLGENRMPEAFDRQGELKELLGREGLPTDKLRWHFIGHLQSRKAAAVSGNFCLLHGVDSLKLARKLGAQASADGRREPILLEINVGRESQKYGFDPGKTLEAVAELAETDGLDLQGMMAMAPFGADPKTLHQVFADLRLLNEEARRQTGLALPELSMGMS